MSRRLIFSVFLSFITAFFVVTSLFPFLWTFLTSIKPERELYSVPFKYRLSNFTLASYRYLFAKTAFLRWFVNSVMVAVTTTALSILVSSFGAYALSRFSFRGKDTIALSFLLTQMFPGVLLIIPLFILMRRIQLTDTLAGLIFAYCTFALPFCLWMLKSYFDSIPVEIEECALIDGCTRVGSLFRIVFPLSAPGIASTSVFSWITAWNEFLFAVILLSSSEKRVLTIGLESFLGEYEIHWGLITSGGVVTALPTVILFAFIQKNLVAGLTSGSLKV